MRRLVAVLSIVAGSLLFAAGPAFAHEEINPSAFPTGKPTFFTLTAANEKAVGLTKVTLTAPEGLDFGSATRSPSGWTADRTATTITWSGGSVAADQFDTWGFEIEGADQPASLTYKVGLGFADGSTDDVDVVVTATSPGTSPGTSVGTETGPASTSATTSGGDSDAAATAAFVLAILALVVAAIAVSVAVRGRRAGSAPSKEGGTGKDW